MSARNWLGLIMTVLLIPRVAHGADQTVTIPGGSGPYNVTVHFLTATLGEHKTLSVKPADCYHFTSAPSLSYDPSVLMVTQTSYGECEATYDIYLVGTHREGAAHVTGSIAPGSCNCSGGGGTPPPGRDFDVTIDQRRAWIYFTSPSNGNNLTACAGSASSLSVKVVLGNAGIPAGGTVTFSASPTTLGTFNPSSASLLSGDASTQFTAGPDGGSGTITASASGVSDGYGNTVSVSTNISANVVKIVQTGTHGDDLWWFAGNDAQNYNEEVTLTAQGVTTGTFLWEVTAGQTRVNLNNGGADADSIGPVNNDPTITVKSTQRSDSPDDVTVRLTYNGTTVCDHKLTVYAPKTADEAAEAAIGAPNPKDDTFGVLAVFSTTYWYQFFDQFGTPVPRPLEVHEEFGEWVPDVTNDWCCPSADEAFTETAAHDPSPSYFPDTMARGANCPYVPCTPPPQPPDPTGACSSSKVLHANQGYYAGSLTGGGILVEAHRLQFYRCCARHE